ncbi:MAG: AAA family ATPase [Acidimicrobiia bacterium]|nr:AAA family ATPase [Acidimicrobiia bacterium]
MAGRELKQLFTAFGTRDELSFRRAAQAIIEEEEAKQHHALARDLRRLIAVGGESSSGDTVVLPDPPRDRDNDWPLAEVRQPSRYLTDLVVNESVETAITGIAAESAHAQILADHGVPLRRRILFWGPPGCGKTSGAEALASELGVPLVVVRLDSVISSYLGQTAANLRQIMEYAHQGRWLILFDEFDAIGRLRDDPTEHGEIKRVVNAFLQMLDQYQGPSTLVAATNHERLLDTALWRRFDDVVEFRKPTVHQIRQLLRLRLSRIPSSRPDIDRAASLLKGLPHAAVEFAIWDAYRSILLEGNQEITAPALGAAIERTRQRPW